MKKINNKKLLETVTLIILIFVPLLKFISIYLQNFKVINNYDSINPAIILYISIPILLYIYIRDIIDKKRKLDIFDYIFYALVLTGIFSTIFSIDKVISIFGKDFRHEGLLSVLSYYLLFINYKVNGDKKIITKLLKAIVIIGIINSVYSCFQVYTKFSFILDSKLISGLCGNQNFFGSLIVTCLGIIIGKILIDKKILIKDILIMILLFVALINSQSTGPFVALVCTFIFLTIYLIIKKKFILKNTLVILFTLVITFFTVQFVNKNVYKSPVCELCPIQIKETVNTGYNGRIDIWKKSLSVASKNLIVGVGYDNLYLAYPNPKIENSVSITLTDILFNKGHKIIEYHITDNAHNVYLHTLVSVGILGLIPYLLLLLITFMRGLKLKDNLGIILLGGFIAYSIQAFGNISVIQVAPIYYVIIGLLLSIKE